MPGFQINDIVRIKKPSIIQPHNLLGLIGYITRFSEDEKYVDIKEIKFNSVCEEIISVDFNCVEHYDDIRYESRLNEILPKIDKLEQASKTISVLENEIERVNERWRKLVLFNLSKFIDEFCISGENESCKIIDFRNRFQNYVNDSFPGITIAKFMINQLKYSYFIENGFRYYKGLSLKL